MAEARPNFSAAGLVLALFALPFFGVGVGMTWWQWREYSRSREILSEWTPVPARVESAELKRGRGSKGSTTYRAVGAFSYELAGRTRRSETLTTGEGSDNIGGFQRNLHREMRAALKSGRPLTAYVNPADPAEAVLRPGWRAEMGLFKAVFGVVFGGVGGALLFGSALAAADAWRNRGLRDRHPDEPWRWRADWAAGVLRPPFPASVSTALAALVMLNASTLPLWTALPAEWAAGGGFRWLLAGALIGVATGCAFCVRTLARAWRHRGVEVVMTDAPWRPGEPARLGLRLPRGLASGSILRLEIACDRLVTTGRGKQRRTERTNLWRHEQEIAERIFAGQTVEISAHPPADLPSSSTESSDERHVWELRLKGSGPGPDLVTKIELPVFARKDRGAA